MKERQRTFGGFAFTSMPSMKPRAESVPSEPSEPTTMIPLLSSMTMFLPKVP